MTPSTPPRSRGTRYLAQPSGNTSSSALMQGQKTPQKPSQNLVPVTPSTTKSFKNAPLLAPPNSNMGMTSPFNGLTSPQRSPFPKSSVKRTLFQFESHDNGTVREEQEPLGRVNRILFPTQQNVDIDAAEEEEEGEVLLPPADLHLPGSYIYHLKEMSLIRHIERRLLKMYLVRPATR
ncbi:ATV_HP_G0016650.mRNA.1.CDS.1 [Saccharomyces cerevisiae]|nr:ATV_HP_G0016650.mRNA.1.CDS.1 [Saccharomyces cerevisiae]CAI6951765.1 ATV_HP_G0016650.mRNA.1.CDS.1 [Saccharomyces cerevisiae]